MKLLKVKIFWFLIYFTFKTTAQIQHLEPLNWWVGLKNPNLQLLINGNEISETIPTINYPGVSLKKINKTDSENYLILDLILAKNTKAGTFKIDFTKNKKIVYSYNYTLLNKEQESTKMVGFNAADVIYLITPDRFVNGNYANDSIPGMKEITVNRNLDYGRHGGDIQGIINSLDYISDMGFTAIWITPLLENDMPAYSYHGYAITNHYMVDPRFGTLNDYILLSQKAKQKGIKLIFDEVLNHTGLNYWWKNDLPYKNWINFPDKYQPTNHRRTVNQDIYASKYDKNLMVNGWFDTSMPDMNGNNVFMANYLIQNTIWWIETLQLGGVRQDTYGYSEKAFLKNWSCAIIDEYPNFNLIGEEWSLNPLITSYWQKGKQNIDGYNGCLNSIMDFPLQNSIIKALNEKEGWDTGLVSLYEAIANDFVYADPSKILIMGDNHDMNRLFTQLNKDVILTKMALAFLLTSRGIPQIYYGTEVLMDNTGYNKNDGQIRSDFPGGWKEDSINSFSKKGLNSDQIGMQNYLKILLNWRKNNEIIAKGKTLHFAPFLGIYVYFRYLNDRIVMVVINKNDTETTIKTDRFNEILREKKFAKNIVSNELMQINKSIIVAPKSANIFEIN